MLIASTIILAVLAALAVFGLSKSTLKDFRIGTVWAVVFLLLTIGLSFIPGIDIRGVFLLNVGAAFFYLITLALFFVYGRFSTQMTALAISVVIGGVLYAATRVAVLLGGAGTFFAHTNAVYAAIAGLLSFAFTRNGKYAFICAGIAMLLLNMLTQIGSGAVTLWNGFAWTVLASGIAAVLYEMSAKLSVKPSKVSYYFEAGRLED
ncbi:MAG: hypothetical protein LBN25_05050 [Christensenellaceae bacterium]|jgi:hypothetical protein|nr:hypothetical protein [Christensenellaceae bacterium]